MNNFLKRYRQLAIDNISQRNWVYVLLLELISSSLNVAALLILGFCVQLITNEESRFLELLEYLPVSFGENPRMELVLIILVPLNILLLVLSALVSFISTKTCRKFARQRYTRNLSELLEHHSNLEKKSLTLNTEDHGRFESTFTTGVHISSIAIEALLKLGRPVSQILVFGIPLLLLDWRFFLAIFFLSLFIIPFVYRLNKNTVASSKAVFGNIRREVYSDILSLVRSNDLFHTDQVSTAAYSSAETAEPKNLTSMLDSFDYWKLSSERINFTLAIIKSVGIQVGVLCLVIILYIVSEITLPVLVVIALAALRLQDAIMNLLTRITVLSRLFPIVNQYIRVRNALLNAKESVNSGQGATFLGTNKKILIVGVTAFKRSSQTFLMSSLESLGSQYSIEELLFSKPGQIARIVQGQGPTWKEIKNYQSRYFVENALIRNILEKLNRTTEGAATEDAMETELSWSKFDQRETFLLALIKALHSEQVDHIQCNPVPSKEVAEIMSECFNRYPKPLVVFSRQLPDEIDHFDIVLSSDTEAQSVAEEDMLFV